MAAKGNTPEKAALLANLWAQTFVADIRGSLSVSAGLIVQEIIGVEETTRKDLEDATEQMKKFEQEVGIGGLKQAIETKNLSLYGLTIQTQTETDPQDVKKKIEKESVKTSDTFSEALIPQRAMVEKTIKTTEGQIALLNAYLEPLEASGLWIGEQILSSEKPEAELEEQLSRAEAAWKNLEEEVDRSNKAAPWRNCARRWKTDNGIDEARQDLRRLGAPAGDPVSATEETLQGRIEDLTAEKTVLEEEINRRQSSLHRLNGAHDRVAVLKTRLNYVRLTAEYQGADASGLTRSWLQEDIRQIDVQIQKAAGELLMVEAKLAQSSPGNDAAAQSLRTQQKFYREKIQELEGRKAALRLKSLDEMRQDLLAAGQVEQASASFNAMRKDYLQAKQKRDQAMGQLQQSQASLRGLNIQIRTLEEEIGVLSRKISDAEATLKGLEKRRDTFSAALENISEQVSEAVTEKGRRISDVRVQSLAVPPDRKIAPKRSLWVLTAGMLVLLFDLGFLLVRRLFELAPEPDNRAESGMGSGSAMR
jgi:chromosome segregation ATPase